MLVYAVLLDLFAMVYSALMISDAFSKVLLETDVWLAVAFEVVWTAF